MQIQSMLLKFYALYLTVRGLLYQSIGQFSEAVKNYSKAIDLDSGLIWSFSLRAKIYAQTDRPEKALADLDHIARQEPQAFVNAKLTIVRAKVYVALYQYEQALEDFDQAIELNPRLIDAFIGRGTLHQLQERYEESIADFSQAIELQPKLAEIVANRGQVYQITNRYQEALSDFNQALKLNPELLSVYLIRGRLYQILNYHDKAIVDFSQVIELGSQFADTFAQRGLSYQLLGQYVDALKDFNQAIELDPQLAWVLDYRGQIYQQQGLFEQALEDFTQASRLGHQVDWNKVLDHYDQVLFNLSKTPESSVQLAVMLAYRAQLHQGLQQYDDALADLNHSIMICPSLDWTFLARSQVNQVLQHYQAALADVNEAISLNPEFAIAIAQRGTLYQILGDRNLALNDFNSAISLNPNTAWFFANRGQIYQELERYDSALADFNQAVNLAADWAWVSAKRGQVLQSLACYEEALSDFDRALQSDCELYWVRICRGQVNQALGKHEEAVFDYGSALQNEDRYNQTELGWIIANRAMSYQALEQYEKALEDLHQAIELNSGLDWAIANRGQIYQELKQYDRSIDDFNRAIELNPNFYWAIAYRGKAYEQVQRLEESLDEFDRAIELEPRFDWAIINRGRVYQRLGEYQEALSDFNEAITLDPTVADYYYSRALLNLFHNQLPNLVQADLEKAIDLCSQLHYKQPKNLFLGFELALYYLVSNQQEESEKIYIETLRRGASLHQIEKAVDHLTAFLNYFPSHQQAKYFQELLQSVLWKGASIDGREMCFVIHEPIKNLEEKLFEIVGAIWQRDYWVSKTIQSRREGANEEDSDYIKESFPTECKILGLIEADIDEDGQVEICFAAGLPSYFSFGSGIAGILDPWRNGHRFIPLVTSEGGFRDIRVSDINDDGRLEIISLWQQGSGAYLSPYIFQWNGHVLKSIFPESLFHQGYMDVKDLDADGVDELIFWESRWEGEARWLPTRFDIHIFRYGSCTYELQETKTSTLRYPPSQIVSKRIGILGQPLDTTSRMIVLSELRTQLNNLLHQGQKDRKFSAKLTKFIDKLSRYQEVERGETFYQTSLSISELAIEAAGYLPDPIDRFKYLVDLWYAKSFTYYLSGSYTNAISSLEQSILLWQDSLTSKFSRYHLVCVYRQMGALYYFSCNYEKALSFLSKSQQLLEKFKPLDEEGLGERSRLLSNFGLVYAEMGSYALACHAFEEAIQLDRQLERQQGLCINYVGLGGIYRSQRNLGEAIKSYQSALKVFEEVSDRERESDVYLQLGLTLSLNNQYVDSLQNLQQALLLTTTENFYYQAGVHYLFIGEAHRKLGDSQLAQRYFQKAIALSNQAQFSETAWKASYGLALTYNGLGLTAKSKDLLTSAIDIIERLRVQSLPDLLKISLFSEKLEPYKAIILSSLFDANVDAFNYTERAKSRSFIEELSVTSLNQIKGVPPELLGMEKKLIEELRQIQLQQRQIGSLANYSEGDGIEEIRSKLEQLWNDMRCLGSGGDEYTALRKASPLDFNGVRQLLLNP